MKIFAKITKLRKMQKYNIVFCAICFTWMILIRSCDALYILDCLKATEVKKHEGNILN